MVVNIYPTISRVYLQFITSTYQFKHLHLTVYGAKPSSVIDVIPSPLPAKAHPKALDMVEHMQQVHKEVKMRTEAASARYKAKVEIHRRRRVTFQEGDLV